MTHNRGITKQTKTIDIQLENTQKYRFWVALTKRKAAANANTQITPKANKSKSHRVGVSSASNSVGTVGHLFA
eukprot:646344-Heterocapsa_arctica.AAC.1